MLYVISFLCFPFRAKHTHMDTEWLSSENYALCIFLLDTIIMSDDDEVDD